jgi:hypothetical protein
MHYNVADTFKMYICICLMSIPVSAPLDSRHVTISTKPVQVMPNATPNTIRQASTLLSRQAYITSFLCTLLELPPSLVLGPWQPGFYHAPLLKTLEPLAGQHGSRLEFSQASGNF